MNETINMSQPNTHTRVNPLKFALWMGFASIMMMFAALTSAYVVRRAGGNWLEFDIPNMFYISTGVLLVSSVLMHFAYSNYKKRNIKVYRGALIGAFILGCLFLVCQALGFYDIYELGVDLKGNPSGGFFYVIPFIHALHIMGGLAALVVSIINSFTLKKFTEKRKINFELTIQYWHFVDILWIYLLVFLLMNR